MRVAVAVIYNREGRILLTQRAPDADHGGQWEFPGGKLEAGESADDALVREVKEEVGLDVLEMSFLTDITFAYATKTVCLHFYRVTSFSGQASCRETQSNLRWVKPDELNQYDFPEANRSVLALLIPQ